MKKKEALELTVEDRQLQPVPYALESAAGQTVQFSCQFICFCTYRSTFGKPQLHLCCVQIDER
jgi:hypothetical protein